MRTLSILLVLVATPASVEARVPDSVALARICWSEAGVDSRATCEALYVALTARGRHLERPWAVHARAYASSVFDPAKAQSSRPWLGQLRARGAPPGFPLPWSRWAPRWRALLRWTAILTRTTRPSPCYLEGRQVEPWDWGVGGAVERYRRAYPRAVELDCPCDSARRCNTFLRPWPPE